MTIQIGDKLPAGTLKEFIEVETEGCSLGPNDVDVVKATAGKTDVPWSEVGGLLKAAGVAMMTRGGARLGDKTVVDAIQAVADATAGIAEQQALRERAAEAATASLAAFRGRPCRVGRARMYPTESTNADDPGMLAFVRLTEALCR